MNDLSDLYTMPEHIIPRNQKLIELVDNCSRAERFLLARIQAFPPEDRKTIEEYISLRDTLEITAINQAIRFGKRSAQ